MLVLSFLLIAFLHILSIATSKNVLDENLDLSSDKLDLAKILVRGNKYFFLSLNALGLANRLRIMASWFSIAKSESRELIVLWNSAQDDCRVQFNNLFERVPDSKLKLYLVNHSFPN